MRVSIAQVHLFGKCQRDKCVILSCPYEVVCVCLESMVGEVAFDSQPLHTGENAICRLFSKWERESAGQGEKTSTRCSEDSLSYQKMKFPVSCL